MTTWKGTIGQGFSPSGFRHYVDMLTFGAWRPQCVVLHNTGRPRLAEWHTVSGAQRMTNLTDYYKNRQHWSAGPHLFVADDLIWVFTPLSTPGVHSPSWNSLSWGVEMVGDYATEPFGNAVRGNTIDALTTLHAAIGLDPQTLKFHKEDPLTTHDCPGKYVVKADLIAAVSAQLSARHAGEHQPGHGWLAE